MPSLPHIQLGMLGRELEVIYEQKFRKLKQETLTGGTAMCALTRINSPLRQLLPSRANY